MLSRDELKSIFRDAGWNQAKLAAAIGRTPAWLNKIMGGTRGMNQKYIEKICNLTGISPNDLFGWKTADHKSVETDAAALRKLAGILNRSRQEELFEILGKILGKT